MKNALIFHGKPKKERYLDPNQPKPHEANWLPWLAAELNQRNIVATVPDLPEPYAPNYQAWWDRVKRYDINENTGLVGHSAGAGFIIRMLSENPNIRAERAVLVAPWHDRNHEYGKDFFDYEIDPNLVERVGRITIYNSTDDGLAVHKSVELLRGEIPNIRYREFENYGHFMIDNNMVSPEFPALLGEMIN